MPPKSDTSRSGRRQTEKSSSSAGAASLEQQFKTEIERIIPAVHVHIKTSKEDKKKPSYGCIKVSPPRSIEQGSQCRKLPVDGIKQWLSEATSIETNNLDDIIIANFPDGIQASYDIDELVEYILDEEEGSVAHPRRELQLAGERRSFLDALDELQISSKEWKSEKKKTPTQVESSQEAAKVPTRWSSSARYAHHVNKVREVRDKIRTEGPDTQSSATRDHDYCSTTTNYSTTLQHYMGSD